MITKDAVLFFILTVLIMLSIAALFYRSVVLEDFLIMSNESDASFE